MEAQAGGQQAQQEAHCKWKGKSYVHCSWVPFDQLRRAQEKIPIVKRRVQMWFRSPRTAYQVTLELLDTMMWTVTGM